MDGLDKTDFLTNESKAEKPIRVSGEVAVILPNGKNLTKQALHKKDSAIHYMKPDEVHQLLAAIPQSNYRDYVMLNLLWLTGIRATEVVNIEKGFYDSFTHTLTIRWLKNRKFAYRTIPLRPEAEMLLIPYMASMNSQDVLFSLTRQRVDQIVKGYARAAGLPPFIHTHTFRHSFAVNYLVHTNDLVGLKTLLGHQRLQTTMVYLRFTNTDLLATLKKVPI
jgi:site-specific recombinase XerD